MSKEYLIQELKNIENAKRDNRQRVANIVCDNPNLVPYLVEVTLKLKTNFL